MTNGDRIRKMTDEDLAFIICSTNGINECRYCAYANTCDCIEGNCGEGVLKYLKKEIGFSITPTNDNSRKC